MRQNATQLASFHKILSTLQTLPVHRFHSQNSRFRAAPETGEAPSWTVPSTWHTASVRLEIIKMIRSDLERIIHYDYYCKTTSSSLQGPVLCLWKSSHPTSRNSGFWPHYVNMCLVSCHAQIFCILILHVKSFDIKKLSGLETLDMAAPRLQIC